MRSSSYFKTISQILILAMLHLCWLTSHGYAEMIPTESANQVQDDRQRILDLLDRQDVVDELGKYGISKVEAATRINSLTDEEVTKIAGRLNELSEGGQANMGGPMIGAGAAVLIIVPAILLVTFYIAFLPIAAGVCVFVEDSWSECIEDYWGFFAKPLEGMYGPLPNEEEEVKENKVEDNSEKIEKLKEGQKWCQHPDTNEWIPCEEQQE